MNGTTREIAARFNITSDEAIQVQNIVECCVGIDYSEATQAELNAAFDEAFAIYDQRGVCC